MTRDVLRVEMFGSKKKKEGEEKDGQEGAEEEEAMIKAMQDGTIERPIALDDLFGEDSIPLTIYMEKV